MLDEYQPRLETNQYEMINSIHIEHLHFVYKQTKVKRKQFVLQLEQPITFQMGESILITGNSGAGKSTFYDIISGCISKTEYTANVQIDNHIQLPDAFHNIESLRTLVLQDTQMDFKCSIFTMITDIEENDDIQQKFIDSEEEKRVWRFLRLVEIDNFVEENLQGQIYVPVENRLSGGQKTRLMLARALNRAEQRQSQILILDEPDRGLPSETTFRIMLNIVQWFRTKGILLLTLHNDRVRERLPLDQILHIEHGNIRSTRVNTSTTTTSMDTAA
jgi:ABC-type bacteriocin/lantibiotic exporter with double-glycine peptidase domain